MNMEDKAVILGDAGLIAKHGKALVVKIAGLWGFGIEKRAREEGKATIIRAKADEIVGDLRQRAQHRREMEEIRHQWNMENVVMKSLPLLREDADPDAIDDDWLENLLHKARRVSNDDMQQLWARLLAGEVNAPGSFSKKTVNVVADLGKDDAVLFTALCGFVVTVDGRTWPFVYRYSDDIYKRQGIDFERLLHLDNIGLISMSRGIGTYRLDGLPRMIEWQYFDKSLTQDLPQPMDNAICGGITLFSRAGEQLAPISGASPVDGFLEYLTTKWTAIT